MLLRAVRRKRKLRIVELLRICSEEMKIKYILMLKGVELNSRKKF